MKKGLGALPVPLQRQVLARVGLSAAAAAAGRMGRYFMFGFVF